MALIKEIILFAAQCPQRLTISTIHFGGGTPSTYPNHLLLDMLAILRKEFNIERDAEIAFEVNPGTACIDQIRLWAQIGINRLSIGVQSLKDTVLKNLNRHQTTQQVYQVLRDAEAVFDNISVDLILGLPDVTDIEWKTLIEQAVNWPLKHMSIYFLTVHETTPLYFKVKANQILLPPDDEVVALYQWTCDKLDKHGFVQYELSNFAKSGYESRHNSAYWDRMPYRGFGIGACSFDGNQRMQNEKNIIHYMQAMENGDTVVVFFEELTPVETRLEQLMLGLRRPKGVLWTTMIKGCDEKEQQRLLTIIQNLEQEQFIEWVENSIRLTPRGLAVENKVLVQLIA